MSVLDDPENEERVMRLIDEGVVQETQLDRIEAMLKELLSKNEGEPRQSAMYNCTCGTSVINCPLHPRK